MSSLGRAADDCDEQTEQYPPMTDGPTPRYRIANNSDTVTKR